MSAVVLLDQAVAYVRAGLTKKQALTVQKYAGEFSGSEMSGVSYACPAVLLTVLGWKKPGSGARLTGRHARLVRLAAFVVTKNAKSREDRMAEAMALAEELSVLIRQWAPMEQEPTASALAALGVTAAGLEDEPTCENLYGAAVDKQGQALWLVDWYQCVKGHVPLAPPIGAVPAPRYEALPELVSVAIEDTVHVGHGPAAAPSAPSTLVVTEKIDFVNP